MDMRFLILKQMDVLKLCLSPEENLKSGGDGRMNSPYGLHESLELHEIATFKTVCMTKSKTMQALISDEDLKQIIQQDIELSTRQLQEINGLLSNMVV